MTQTEQIIAKIAKRKERSKRKPERDAQVLKDYAEIPESTYRSLAIKYGVNSSRIQQIINGVIAKHEQQ